MTKDIIYITLKLRGDKMKLAIFSDLHGNFTAWQQAFSVMQKKNIDKYLCAGDLVGYGPQPNKTIAHLREKKEEGLDIEIVLGNHDQGVIEEKSLKRFNSHAKQSIRWTRKKLSTKNKEFLNQIPLKWQKDNLILAHGTPNNPIWEYLRTFNASKIFANYDFKYCFVGHTHLLQAFSAPKKSSDIEKMKVNSNSKFNIPQERRVVFNVGSIGQPRDKNPQSSFIILDTNKNQIEVVRTKYDIKKVQQLIYQSNLPDIEGNRLAEGR